MGQAEIIIDMIQCQLLPYAVLAFAERVDAPSHRRHMLADGQVEALHKRRLDLPAAGRQHLLDRVQRAKDDLMPDADQTATSHGLDPLRIEQPGQGPPARFWRWALCPLARSLDPVTVVGQ